MDWVFIRFWATLFALNFLYDFFTYVPYQTLGRRVWMVTDGRNRWVEGMYNAQGVAMTYEEIMEEQNGTKSNE